MPTSPMDTIFNEPFCAVPLGGYGRVYVASAWVMAVVVK